MMTSDELAAVAATEIQRMQRLAAIGDSPTSGPSEPHDVPAVAVSAVPSPRWVDGWWAGAKRTPAHPGRVGGAITPWSTVVHTTDMLPEEWAALVAAWTTRAGEGACAHFLVGRDEAHGVVQFAPITRNGNHAGGPGHGVYVVGGKQLHPNLVAVGIEIHCAGGVQLINGAWRLVEGGAAHGAVIPASDVAPDPARPGRGWHVVTEYQREQVTMILGDLETVLARAPAGATKLAFGETPPTYAVLPGARVATHAELDPVHRADPWPLTSAWLKARTFAL